jgi:hypothetical protein
MNAKKSDRWLAALTALAVATLACSALGGGGGATETPPKPRVPTQTPKAAAPTTEAATAEAEATATRPPKPTKTPPPALPSSTPASGPGDVLYYTGFDDLTDWTTILALPKTDQYTAEAQNGKLYIEVDASDTTVYAFYDKDIGQGDVQVDADVETVAGPNRNNISLVCRAGGDGWYEFSMNSGGYWYIWRYVPGKGWTKLKEGGTTAINLQKAKNHLTAVCQGDTLTLYINDVEVGSASDDQFTEGQVGVSVSTFNIKGAGVEFDYVAVSAPR